MSRWYATCWYKSSKWYHWERIVMSQKRIVDLAPARRRRLAERGSEQPGDVR
ncbi:hypothetical protein GCM10023198_58560 [Promicromonospora umidemergens]|uniref:Uncharacterized protein n=1 Tax=Promicromonospora umidemergens TaxID=629679 RepID=A0ABP8YB62_9MICO